MYSKELYIYKTKDLNLVYQKQTLTICHFGFHIELKLIEEESI